MDSGHTVSFLVLTQGQSEEYSALHPIVLGYSSTYDMILSLPRKMFRKKSYEDTHRRWNSNQRTSLHHEILA